MKIKNECVNEIIVVKKRKRFGVEAFLSQVSIQEEEQRETAMYQDEKTFYIGHAQARTRNAATGALLDHPASSSPGIPLPLRNRATFVFRRRFRQSDR